MEVGGFRRLEAAITALVLVVVLAFGLEIFISTPPAAAVAGGVFEPRLPGGAALLAVSIVGATVMPHVHLPAFRAHQGTGRRRLSRGQAQDLPLRGRRRGRRDGPGRR